MEEAKGKMAEEIGTVQKEVTELRENVKEVWSAVKARKEDVTKKYSDGWTRDRQLRAGDEKGKRTRPTKGRNKEEHDGDREIKRRPAGNKEGIGGRKGV